jgi:adenylate kinase family enzyme
MYNNTLAMKSLLLKQYELYPKMQVQDLVKLVYQSEFAGGHLIADEKSSLQKLQEECRALEKCPPSRRIPDFFEEIGSGLCRFHLTAVQSTGIDLKTVNRIFLNTANSICGSIESFEEKLDVLKQCCKERDLPYPIKELETYLDIYKSQGYPPVSHSENYRDSYFPAYRIVKKEYRNFFEVFCRLDLLLKSKDPVNVAIDGNSGAGKSTLAMLIARVYECNIFHMDDFFLTPELKTQERLKEIGGNVDYLRFRQEVITGLHSGREFQYRTYDCRKKVFGQLITVNPKKLNIIEGSYSMHPTLINNYDLKIFLQTSEKEQRYRILKRDGAAMQKRFSSEWIPLENKYFEEMKIIEQSDMVLQC